MALTNPTAVVRLRLPASTGPDEYGDAIIDWSTATRLTLNNAYIAPTHQTEVTDHNRQGRPFGYALYLRGQQDADITATDRIEWRGHTFTIKEVPEVWDSPWSDYGGQVVHLERFEG